MKRVVVILLSVTVGLAVGYAIRAGIANKQGPKIVTTPMASIQLPNDAALIQTCAAGKGALYARPGDIPVGPIFMVNNNKVIGVEYMLNKSLFSSNQNFNGLIADGVRVDHAMIEPEEHQGFDAPHYHVDLFQVSSAEADAIKCAAGSSDMMNMPGM